MYWLCTWPWTGPSHSGWCTMQWGRRRPGSCPRGRRRSGTARHQDSVHKATRQERVPAHAPKGCLPGQASGRPLTHLGQPGQGQPCPNHLELSGCEEEPPNAQCPTPSQLKSWASRQAIGRGERGQSRPATRTRHTHCPYRRWFIPQPSRAGPRDPPLDLGWVPCISRIFFWLEGGPGGNAYLNTDRFCTKLPAPMSMMQPPCPQRTYGTRRSDEAQTKDYRAQICQKPAQAGSGMSRSWWFVHTWRCDHGQQGHGEPDGMDACLLYVSLGHLVRAPPQRQALSWAFGVAGCCMMNLNVLWNGHRYWV